jgi:hypothetical protein
MPKVLFSSFDQSLLQFLIIGRWVGKTLWNVFNHEFSFVPESYWVFEFIVLSTFLNTFYKKEYAWKTGRVKVNNNLVTKETTLNHMDVITHDYHGRMLKSWL